MYRRARAICRRHELERALIRAREEGATASKNLEMAEKVDGRRARGDRARGEILQHALGLASVQGLEGLTIGQLAADAGISKGNISVLFGDKESLQLATMDAYVERFVKQAVEPALRKRSPIARLRALCDGWFERIEARVLPGGCFMYATAHEYRARPGVLRDRAASDLKRWRDLLETQLVQAEEAGELARDVDVRSAVLTLVSYQNTAHLAQTMDDDETFAHAWRLSREYLRSLTLKRKS